MIKQRLTQTQTQRLIMTPQLQMAVRLLQLSTLELKELLDQEIMQNPILELEDPEERIVPPVSTSLESETIKPDDQKALDDINWNDILPDDRNWEHHTEYEYNPDFNKDEFISNQTKVTTSIYEHLQEQLRFLVLSNEDKSVAEEIIGNIEPDGYIRTDLNEIALKLSVSADKIEKVLKLIQEFEPAGIGARDIRECLCIQAIRYGLPKTALTLLSESNFSLFVSRQYEKIARNNKLTLLQVEEAARTIAHLEPKPGRQFQEEPPHFIAPDVVIEKNSDGVYEAYLVDDQIPQLKISPSYLEMLRHKETLNPKDYEFILDKFRSARVLIRNIERRKKTILQVTDEIAKTQNKFLDQGIDYLRPLKLKEIADKLGIHESTVARVTTNKYVHTPQGLFELKYFFSQGLSTEEGDDVSARSVKNIIQQLISQENPKHPLSDQTIAEILKNKNIQIARRTVAKYREQLKILPAHLRKKIL